MGGEVRSFPVFGRFTPSGYDYYCVVMIAAVTAAEVVVVVEEVVGESDDPPPPQPAKASSVAAAKARAIPISLNGFMATASELTDTAECVGSALD
jgi:hypothetical protein